MFGLKSHRKRKELLLRCPSCGAEQREPALAISSNCRRCGGHFRIEKGEAVLPPGAAVSGISMLGDWGKDSEPNRSEAAVSSLGARARTVEKSPDSGRGVGETWMAGGDREPEKNSEESGHAEAGSGKEPGRGPVKREERSAEEAPPAPDEKVGGPGGSTLGDEAQPVEALRQGSMSAMLGQAAEKLSEIQAESGEDFRPRMPRGFVPAAGGRKPGPATREVRCFECNHQQPVSLAATSTQCARCSVYISLVDHDISTSWSQNIRTRGNVHVRKKGSVTGCDVACHHLEVDGRISATVDCSGHAIFRQSARIMGHMHCQHLVVEKKCEVIFPQGVWAQSIEVYGTVVGNLTCAGTIRIHRNARVEGDAVARAVDLKDGGELSGRMSIQPDLDITPREREGYLKTF